MLDKAHDGLWSEITSAGTSFGEGWSAIWQSDSGERAKGVAVKNFLHRYQRDGAQTQKSTAEPADKNHTKADLSGDGNGWDWPSESARLDGTSIMEKWLSEQIDLLNDHKIPTAARLYVRNKRIAGMKRAGEL